MNIEERFAGMTSRNGECLDWIGPTAGGVPYFSYGGGRVPARKYAYEDEFMTTVPPGRAVIAACGNPLCVEADHLAVTRPSHLKDTSVPRKNNSTGVRGVTHDGHGYRGQVRSGGKTYRTSRFPTLGEASAAVDALRRDVLSREGLATTTQRGGR